MLYCYHIPHINNNLLFSQTDNRCIKGYRELFLTLPSKM